MTPVDALIARLAGRQHGNVTQRQLRDLGVTRNGIAHRVKLGRLHRVHRGVYAVGRSPRTALERASAAVLACGPGAVLSHHSALALWGLTPRWPATSDVIVQGDRRPTDISVHRARLAPADARSHQGIPVTSPARTLLDCAPKLTDRALMRAFNDARRTLGLQPGDLAGVVQRNPKYRGAGRLKALAGVRGGPTRSQWEDEFPAFCRRFGLPEPAMSTVVAGLEVDALFPEEKVIVELDSWRYHSDRAAFERDRERDAITLAAGHVTVRITWERMHARAAEEAVRLHKILQQRRSQAA